MSKFTTVVQGVVTLGVKQASIHDIVRDVRRSLLDGAPKNSNVLVSFDLLERPDTVARVFPTPLTAMEVRPPKFHHAFLTLVNVRRRELDIAHIWAEQPMVPSRQFHANDYRTPITCRGCGSDMFYNVDRSLDYENHICAGCGAEAHTLTETGASA